VPEGSYTVTASASGYLSATRQVTVNGGETTTADFILTKIVQNSSISGKVIDEATRLGIAGATVTDCIRTVTAASDGSYTISDVPAGTYTVTASATGYNSKSQQVSVTSGETTIADFVLTKIIQNSSISGKVIDEVTGLAIAGARVGDGIRTVTAASDGSYTIPDVPAGTYIVTASATGYNNASQSVTVGENEVSSVADFSLTPISKSTTVSVSSISYSTEGGKKGDRHLQITVALTDKLGNPVAAATVSITVSLNGKLYLSTAGITGSDGKTSFKLNNARPGTYTTVVNSVVAEGAWDGNTPPNSFTK
jgi:hypothetical protein